MAAIEPINIQIDPEALRAQIRGVLDEEFGDFAMKLRHMADILEPSWVDRFRSKVVEDYKRYGEQE